MEHIKSQNEGLYTPEERHEASDVNVRLILAFGVFLIVLAAVVHVGLYVFYRGLDRWYESRQAPSNPMIQVAGPVPGTGQPANESETGPQATRRLVATFPEPRLQPDEYRDYVIFRKRVDEQLNTYSWIDKNAGSVRIPVSRAMELIAERGLPVVKPAPASTTPTTGAGQNATPPAKGAEPKKQP